MKALYFTDPHASYYPPVARKDDYMATLFLKFEEIREIYNRESCEILLCGGDWYHLKSWMRNPYVLTNKLIDYFKTYPRVAGILGDHDLSDRNLENVDRQPIGALVKGAGIHLLSKGTPYPISGCFVTGASKVDAYEEDITNYVPESISGGTHIHLVHGDLYPTSPVYEPYTLYDSLKTSPAGLTLRGHIHRDDGVVQVGTTSIVGIGSLTRGTFNTDNVDRKPGVAVIDTETLGVKVVRLKSAPKAKDIFDFERKAELQRAELEIDRLSALIKHESTTTELQGPEQVFEEIRRMKLPEGIKSTALQLLEKAQEAL
jgi:DNA repair exonuclease SbcCD nuclease subunit